MSASVTIRMYNQNNLGDCFLLKFEDNGKESYLLIDFGSYESGNELREAEIAESIRDTVKDKPLRIVLTHQHKDHLSGFITAESILKDLNITEVWFSYLDDPQGEEAKTMRDATEKFWKKNTENKQKAKAKFAGVPAVEKMLEAKDAFDLFAEEQTGGQAITNLLKWSKNQRQFLLPGKNFDMPGLDAGAVKVYVLGPPKDPALLKKLNPTEEEAVHSLDSMLQLSSLETNIGLIGAALDATTAQQSMDAYQAHDFPFNKKFSYPMNAAASPVLTNYASGQTDENAQNMLQINSAYREPLTTWRCIDHDWLSEMGRVSLHMDTLTNNSSLVLAFELVESRKVVLFVGDAQIGNWQSWFGLDFENSPVKADELLKRTVFYKAGHHSSHNATLKKGLDMMNEEELVIMIPVNKAVSDNRHFLMVKPGMLAGYNRMSKGRVLRSDTIFHVADPGENIKFPFAITENDFTPKLNVVKDKTGNAHLYMEYMVQ